MDTAGAAEWSIDMADCKKVQKMIGKFDHGQLDIKQEEFFIQHVESCKDCREEFEIYYIVAYGLSEDEIALVVNSKYHRELKDYMDDLPNGTNPTNGLFGMYQSVETYESNRMPSDVPAMVMLKEAVALPNYLSEYDAEKIQFDDAIALELFAYSGSGALVPEVILYDCDYTYTEADIESFAPGTTYYTYNFGEYVEVPSSEEYDAEKTYFTRK